MKLNQRYKQAKNKHAKAEAELQDYYDERGINPGDRTRWSSYIHDETFTRLFNAERNAQAESTELSIALEDRGGED